MSTNLRVAVIGAGRMGSDHVERLARRIKGAEVAAVVDVDVERARRVAEAAPSSLAASDMRPLLERDAVDAVVVATPGELHEAMLLEVLARDLPVLCEKPLTPDAASSWRIVEAERRLGRERVQVGFMRRFDAEYRRLRDVVASGELGRLLMLHCIHRNAAAPPGFTDSMLVTDSVVHEFDAIRFLAGEEIKTVQVRLGRPSGHAPQRDPQQVLIETEGGVLADVEIFVNAQLGYQVRAEAVFERGAVTIGEDAGPRVSAAGRWGGAVPPGFVERFAAAYDAQVQSWVDAARRGGVGGPTAWDGYAAACCCEAGVAAQRSGAKVEVTLRNRPEYHY